MNFNEHPSATQKGTKNNSHIQGAAYFLVMMAFTAPLSKKWKPKTFFKYYILSNQSLNTLNHENS